MSFSAKPKLVLLRAPRATAAMLVAAGAALAGCDHWDREQPAPSTPPTSPRSREVIIWPGRLTGQAVIGTDAHAVEGLLASDGELRLEVREQLGSGRGDGVQIVALVPTRDASAYGHGRLFGENCTVQQPSRFCGHVTAVTVNLRAVAGGDPQSTGELTVAAPTGDEVWSLRLGYWGGLPAQSSLSLTGLSGLYRETLGEFAGVAAVLVDLDANGRLFFQSGDTGCVGNGMVSAQPNNVFRAELVIAGCRAERTPLNASFVGLGTFEAETPWDPGPFRLRLWLSTNAGAPFAVASLAERQ